MQHFNTNCCIPFLLLLYFIRIHNYVKAISGLQDLFHQHPLFSIILLIYNDMRCFQHIPEAKIQPEGKAGFLFQRLRQLIQPLADFSAP